MPVRLRPCAPAFVAVALACVPAFAQDRLFTLVPGPGGASAVEIGAIGRFGQILGPAPADVLDFPGKARLFDATATTITNVATGALVFTAGPSEVITAATSTHDRTTVFVATDELPLGFGPRNPRLRAIDVGTGAVTGHIATSYSSLTWDPVQRRLLAWNGSARAFDVFAEDLAPLARADMPGSRCTDPTAVVVSPHSKRAYIGYPTGSVVYSHNFPQVFAVDLEASRLVHSATLGDTGDPVCAWPLILWSAPAPPPGLASAVNGRDVTLTWVPADYAAGYVLEAGAVSGRTDLTVPLGDVTQVSFTNVPPGTYYLRVRGGNRMGTGRPSNELRVVVP